MRPCSRSTRPSRAVARTTRRSSPAWRASPMASCAPAAASGSRPPRRRIAARLSAALAARLHQADGARSLRELALEGDNLLAVLRRALEAPTDGLAAARALAVLEALWSNRGVLAVHHELADAVVAAASETGAAASAALSRAAIEHEVAVPGLGGHTLT